MSGSERRVVIARSVARRWVEKKAAPEYRFTVLGDTPKVRTLTGLLRSFRDRKIAMDSVDPLPDLGICEKFESVELWSSNRQAMLTLKAWCEKRGMETTGLW